MSGFKMADPMYQLFFVVKNQCIKRFRTKTKNMRCHNRISMHRAGASGVANLLRHNCFGDPGYMYVYINIYIYIYIYVCIPVCLMKGIDQRLTPVVHALPSEARHALSEATRFVTANCTQHRLNTAHNTHRHTHTHTQNLRHNTTKFRT